MSYGNRDIERRSFIRTGLAAAGAAAAVSVPQGALANRHPTPNAGSVNFLDRNSYVDNMEVLAHYQFPSTRGNGTLRSAGKSQMMAFGRRRLLFQAGNVYDLTEPKKVTLISEAGYDNSQPQLSYNRKLKKWLLMTRVNAPHARSTEDMPNGKWDDPKAMEMGFKAKGLRGIRMWDATDPTNVKHLSDWSCDQGDPTREVQEGYGTHRNYYGGGQYAYLDTAPDNTFTNMEAGQRLWSNCIQTIDVSDPMKPKFVSNWWFPGQRKTEKAEYEKWRFSGDRESWTSTHGGCMVPLNVEDGGKYGYTAYGAFGMTVHDMSDPRNPKLVGRFDPLSYPGGIPMHTIDTAHLDQGFVIASPEAHNPDCADPYHDVYVVDVRDPTNPAGIVRLPRPVPPANAPYATFCNKRGRFGTHNPPHVHAPGKAPANFTCYSYFNAGIQVYDLSRLDKPKISGYFIPPQGGSFEEAYSWNRDTDNVFVEWDRNLIWAMTSTGMYLLSSPLLGKPIFEPMAVKEWAHPGLNRGHEELKGPLHI